MKVVSKSSKKQHFSYFLSVDDDDDDDDDDDYDYNDMMVMMMIMTLFLLHRSVNCLLNCFNGNADKTLHCNQNSSE